MTHHPHTHIHLSDPCTTQSPVNVVVTLRGKKYEVAAATVEELQKEMEARSGLKPGQQVRFRVCMFVWVDGCVSECMCVGVCGCVGVWVDGWVGARACVWDLWCGGAECSPLAAGWGGVDPPSVLRPPTT